MTEKKNDIDSETTTHQGPLSWSENRWTSTVSLSMALLFVVWCLFGWLAVPSLIDSAYKQESYPLLNKAISGRDVHPVDKYLADWHRLFITGSLALAALAIAAIGLTRQSVRAGVWKVASGCIPENAKQLTQWLAIGIAILVVGQCCVTVVWGDLLSDGAFYLALGRHVARGDVPYQNLPTTYTPGASYIFAVLGPEGVSNPRLASAYFFCVYAINSLLVFAALRQMKHAFWLAVFGASVFATWTLASDGTEILLEPYQIIFILLGMNALLKWPTARGSILAGLAVGASLMVKQYSLLAVPVMAWMSLMPWTLDEAGGQQSHPIDWKRCAAFLGCLGIPWLVFAILTRQDLVDNFVAVATFGGATGDYPAGGILVALRSLTYGHPGMTCTLIVACGGLGLVCIRPSRANLQLYCGFLVWIPLLTIRHYPHYLQLAMPWGVLVMCQLSRELASRISSEERARYAIALLAFLPFVLVVFHPLHRTRYYLRQHRIEHQLTLADEFRQLVPERENIFVLNSTWLYLLADVEPPGRLYLFPRTPDERCLSSLKEAECVVVFPKRSAWMMPAEEAVSWLEENNWEVRHRLEMPKDEQVLVFRKKRAFADG